MKKKLKQMLKQIDDEANYTIAYTGRDKFSKRVMDVMAVVDREKFVPKSLRLLAYENGPLTIGYGQTISQPYIVACMTDFLELTPESIVLEIGTGSGYQAAILSRLAKTVYTIEKIRELYNSATKLLKDLNYNNIETRCSNGYYGWQDKAPFDAIMVTAAATHVPPALIEQLKPGGRMLVPVGLPSLHQELLLVRKHRDGTSSTESILDVAFVPLVIDDRKPELLS
ncbi:MAG: protein-L-isoaspartate(D-aspartate) O-methyltransferase [Thiohalomonadales bacterium]